VESIQLTQPVQGHGVGEIIEVDGERAEWLVRQGYASMTTPFGNMRKGQDRITETDVTSDKDPTLAANREEPADPEPHIANADSQHQVHRGETWNESDSEPEDPKVAWVAGQSVADLQAYMAEHPEKSDEIYAAERSRPAADQRTTLLAGAPFDPSEHSVDEVAAYIVAHPDDADRVRDLERGGRGRKGVVG
jgi:hypothetical protein